mgnify:CR=1 FL=1
MTDIIVDPPHLMRFLKRYKELGLASEINHILIVPKDHEVLKDGGYEGRVVGDTVYLSKDDKNLLLHEIIDHFITKNICDPQTDLINKLLEQKEQEFYRKKEEVVNAVSRIISSSKLGEGRETLPAKDEVAKVCSAKFDKRLGAYVLEIKNADPKYRRYLPITVLTDKRYKKGDRIPVKDLKLISHVNILATQIKKVKVPAAKAGVKVSKIRKLAVDKVKEYLRRGYDVILSYPRAFSFDYDEQRKVVYVTLRSNPTFRFSFKPKSEDVINEGLAEAERRCLGGLDHIVT